jgi:hypothetical protein
MTAMASVTGQVGAIAALPEMEVAEMAELCEACPRTEACRLWLVTHADSSPALAPDLCPNHGRFRALAGDSGLA